MFEDEEPRLEQVNMDFFCLFDEKGGGFIDEVAEDFCLMNAGPSCSMFNWDEDNDLGPLISMSLSTSC